MILIDFSLKFLGCDFFTIKVENVLTIYLGFFLHHTNILHKNFLYPFYVCVATWENLMDITVAKFGNIKSYLFGQNIFFACNTF